jgi:hypothetical protein
MCYERRRAEACLDESAHHALGTREEPGTLRQGAPVFPGSSRMGIEPKTPGWLVQDPTTRPIGDLIPTIGGSGDHPGRGLGPVRNRYFITGCACFPWFLSFGNRTQNSRVAGARSNHQADRGSDPNHQGIWSDEEWVIWCKANPKDRATQAFREYGKCIFEGKRAKVTQVNDNQEGSLGGKHVTRARARRRRRMCSSNEHAMLGVQHHDLRRRTGSSSPE